MQVLSLLLSIAAEVPRVRTRGFAGVGGAMSAASDMSRGMARHSLTLGLARLNREPHWRGGYG